MQSVIDAASNAATIATGHATTLANSAAVYTGLAGHSHAEEHLHRATLPEDAEVSPVIKVDTTALAVFEDKGVRHDVLVKINKLALDDARHGLKEVASLDLVVEGQEKKGISYYHPLRYFTVKRPMGVEYFGEIEIEEGKCIHVRCHKAAPGTPATFHSLDTRPNEEGGAVFATGEPLGWFDY
ncbi:hypothetical protein P7C73_g1349, partial [Tremellales sp. Uapishka_1]